MDFNHSDDRQMLADTLGRFLSERYDFETVTASPPPTRGYSREIWSELAELGIPAALFGEARAASAAPASTCRSCSRALGRALVVEPFLGTLMAGRLLADRTELVEAVIAGTSIARLRASTSRRAATISPNCDDAPSAPATAGCSTAPRRSCRSSRRRPYPRLRLHRRRAGRERRPFAVPRAADAAGVRCAAIR